MIFLHLMRINSAGKAFIKKTGRGLVLFFHPRYVLLALAFWSGPAFAQEYKVTVRQINPDGPVSEALCFAGADSCFMTAEIGSVSGENRAGGPLDVGMRFFTDRVNFNFMWNREYAFTQTYELREKGVDVPLDASGQGRKDVSLLTRSLLQQTDPETSIVLRDPLSLARIEILVRRVPE